MKKLIAVFFLLFSTTVFSDVAIISSDYNITRIEALNIFSLNDFTFADGGKVKMIVLPRDHYTTRTFTRALSMTPARFFDKAESAFSTGKLNLLVIMESDREVYRYILKTDGAIGYVQDYIVDDRIVPTVIRLRGY